MKRSSARRFGLLQIRLLAGLFLFGAPICLAHFSLIPSTIAKGGRAHRDTDRLRYMPERGGDRDYFDRVEE